MTRPKRINIEKLLIDWLAVQLPASGWLAPVADELAAGEYVESVAVHRDGGPGLPWPIPLDNPTITVEAKGMNNDRSSDLINECVSLIHTLTGQSLAGFGVSQVQELGGPSLEPVADSPTRYRQRLSIFVQMQLV